MGQIYLETRSAKLAITSMMPVARYYGKKRLATTTSLEIVPFPNREQSCSLKIWSTQHACSLPLSQRYDYGRHETRRFNTRFAQNS